MHSVVDIIRTDGEVAYAGDVTGLKAFRFTDPDGGTIYFIELQETTAFSLRRGRNPTTKVMGGLLSVSIRETYGWVVGELPFGKNLRPSRSGFRFTTRNWDGSVKGMWGVEKNRPEVPGMIKAAVGKLLK